jgi:predicted metal-dependent hydrolase
VLLSTIRTKNRSSFTLGAVLCVFGAISIGQPELANAQTALELLQPDIVPRSVVIARPFRVYADPALPPEETGLRELSLTDVEAVARRFFARDRRYQIVDFTSAVLGEARETTHEETVFIAEQSARLGYGHHRSYNLASSVSEFDSAIAAYQRTTRSWTHPEDLGEVWLTLARVHLELSEVDPERADEHLAHATEAFRRLIRVNPDRQVGDLNFPNSVVGAYRRAYLDHIINRGAELRLTHQEALRLAQIADAQLVVYAFVMTVEDGHTLVLQAYDTQESRFVIDEEFAIVPELTAVSSAIEAALSRMAACQELIPAPVVEPPNGRGTLYLSTAFSLGTYTTRPTDRVFANYGAKVSLSIMLRETFGLYLSGMQWTAPRDADGELLRPLESTRGVIGVTAGGRTGGRLRAFAVGGLDFTRLGRFRATDSFWCKVSEGEAFEFDEERRCLQSDMVDEEPQLQFGLSFGVGVDVNLSGPFWLHLQGNTSIYSLPIEDRRVNFPLWVDLGFTYELGR